MGKDDLIKQMVAELATKNNTIDLDAYAKGCEDMYRYFNDIADKEIIESVISHSPDPVPETFKTISDVNDPANDNSQLVEFEHLNTLQEGD